MINIVCKCFICQDEVDENKYSKEYDDFICDNCFVPEPDYPEDLED